MAFAERPDLEPHRYFHEVFRLAALVYLHMLLELPPTSYPILLLVRKMLSLVRLRFLSRSLEAMYPATLSVCFFEDYLLTPFPLAGASKLLRSLSFHALPD